MKIVKGFAFLLVPFALASCGEEDLPSSPQMVAPSVPAPTVPQEQMVIPPPDESVNEPEIQLGYTNTIPTCAEAAARIVSSVELGMSKQQIRSLVGKPTRMSRLNWDYGYDLLAPSVGFGFTSTTVDSYDSNSGECGDRYMSMIEAMNSYIQSDDATDYSEDTPNCLDAAIRIAARIELGMSSDEVRVIVGKPVAVNTLSWHYGDDPYQNVTVMFDDVQSPEVRIYDTWIGTSSSCF